METTKTNTLAGAALAGLLTLLAGPAAGGIIAEWRMDEAQWTGATDEVRELIGGAHATAFGPATTTSGLLCRAGDFSADGITDYLTLDNTLLSGRRDFSISVWLRTANNGQQAIVSGARAGQNNELIMWFPNASRFRQFQPGPDQPAVPDQRQQLAPPGLDPQRRQQLFLPGRRAGRLRQPLRRPGAD